MSTRVAVVGCVQFSQRMLRAALALPEIDVAAVVTRSQSAVNTDFRSLSADAESAGIPCHTAKGRDEDAIRDFLAQHEIALGLCVGWSYLLPKTVLATAKHGFIGYHPAALPDNRGRHPLIWALALGLEETASTFFVMDAGADTGAILDQAMVPIAPADTAQDLYERVTRTAESQLGDFLPAYLDGRLKPEPQAPGAGNAWRKRSPSDGHIDWRMTYDAIHNLVRALAPPYPGATCGFDGAEIPIWGVAPGPAAPANHEPGKVLDVTDDTIVVKCWGGSVRLIEHGFSAPPPIGAYLE